MAKIDLDREGTPGMADYGKKYGLSEAQILLPWALQKNYPVLPKSNHKDRMLQIWQPSNKWIAATASPGVSVI